MTFSPGVAEVVQAILEGKGGIPQLTEREREVLALIAEGLSNKEIALRLKMKERTVEFHVGNIFRKMGVASRVEAVVKAKERGIIP